MNNKVYSVNIEFCMVRELEDRSSVNTAITTRYKTLTIPHEDFQKASTDIEKDINRLINKYHKKYEFKLEK
ncbi:hypothetical protein LCGC14_0952110 [marine sediment metagenome]|uniref:Uncharacterized protein n=1 Tax=marine sediment metagenome TaxID=412755 RepID=A0A0F9P351_9ZZZZ